MPVRSLSSSCPLHHGNQHIVVRINNGSLPVQLLVGLGRSCKGYKKKKQDWYTRDHAYKLKKFVVFSLWFVVDEAKNVCFSF